MTKKKITLVLILVFAIMVFGYFKFIKSTKIGFINIRDFQYADITDIKTSFFIDIDRVKMKNVKLSDLSSYDILLLRAHGLTLSKSIKEKITKVKEKGIKVLIYQSTSPENEISNISLKHIKVINKYINNGDANNYSMLFLYLRKYVDKKWIFGKTIKKPFVKPKNYLFYPGVDKYFTSLEKYVRFYKKRSGYKNNNPKVAVFTGNIGPITGKNHIKIIIQGLEKKGLNVYPVSGFFKRLDFLKKIKPDIAIYFPHGRFASSKGKETIKYLKENKIPLLCPVNIFEPFSKWEQSQKGMSGGMLSQSVTVPEFDGGIEPYAVSAQFKNKKGLYVFRAIPKRCEKFCERVSKWVKLKNINNKDKKIAIFYFKSPGKNALVAGGLEVAPSLLNFLKQLKKNGYSTGGLPKNEDKLIEILNKQGLVLGAYANGAIANFIKNGNPELIPVYVYNKWINKKLPKETIKQLVEQYGKAPGTYLSLKKGKRSYIAIPRIKFGNIVILPQTLPAFGDDKNKLIHGVKKAPPHPYIASYLWVAEGFKADALMHFGTHGSMEFTPWKQVALSNHDWPDILVGTLPHIYLYTIGNIGEAMIAKRRSYATIVSHITPPFNESGLYGELKKLNDKIHSYYRIKKSSIKKEYQKTIESLVKSLDLRKELKLSKDKDLTADEMEVIHNYMHTLKTSKITDGLYTLGKPYTDSQIDMTTRLMSIDTIAYSQANIAIAKGLEKPTIFKKRHLFLDKYFNKSRTLVNEILNNNLEPLSILSEQEIKDIKVWEQQEKKPLNTESMMASAMSKKKKKKREVIKTKQYKVYKNIMKNYVILRNGLLDIKKNKDKIINTFINEPKALIAALNGGYISPSSGGDPIRNPNSIPAGRNLYSIDPEQTPSQEAWEVSKKLAKSLIKEKLAKNKIYPQKIAFTLWGSEFIRDEGVTIGQILYLMGVKPVWNMVGRVHDVVLIPDKELNRPRIDVVVQTSGQFRDIASSRIFLINKAVKIASLAKETTKHKNYVKRGTINIEKKLKAEGITPIKSRKYSYARVFGGVNGGYGTGIMGLVESGDKWEKSKEIATQYIKNMGAVYTKDNWGANIKGLFAGALQNTDTIVQSRASNTYGPLSLDHVYEFMGGLNTAIKKVTGKNPDGYFLDMRNPLNPRVQGLQEAVNIEARTTIFNPKYITGLTKGGASSAAVFAETLRNTYGWSSTKPEIIDKKIWEEINDVYINDKYKLNLRKFFEAKNPYALQEISAVLLESARKGFWTPSQETIKTLSKLHVELIKDFDAGCSGFVCNNIKLQKMITNNISGKLKEIYKKKIKQVKIGNESDSKEGMKLEKEALTQKLTRHKKSLIIIVFLILITLLLIIIGRINKKRRK